MQKCTSHQLSLHTDDDGVYSSSQKPITELVVVIVVVAMTSPSGGVHAPKK